MKFFVFIVLSLIGAGVYLRFQNDVKLQESSVSTNYEQKRSETHNKILPQNSENFIPKYPEGYMENNVMAPQEEENPLNIASGSDFHNGDDMGENLTCPYTDNSGQCISDPSDEFDNSEGEAFAANEGADLIDEAPRTEDHLYGKYLNEQTFDSIRTPASEE